MTGYQINYQSEREEGSVIVGASEANITLDGCSHGLTFNITLVALSQHLPSPVVAWSCDSYSGKNHPVTCCPKFLLCTHTHTGQKSNL